jgi:hypothetical protein
MSVAPSEDLVFPDDDFFGPPNVKKAKSRKKRGEIKQEENEVGLTTRGSPDPFATCRSFLKSS